MKSSVSVVRVKMCGMTDSLGFVCGACVVGTQVGGELCIVVAARVKDTL